jgi:predicted HTH transcriptional regulator
LSRPKKRRFTLGEPFSLPENRVCELKEVKGRNPVGSIGSVVDQYVVAFLNAGLEQIGSIFWGVQDVGRTVVGVPLTDSQCDEIRRVVVDRVCNITPPIAPSALSIEFHAVDASGSPPLYVVEVRVPAVQGSHLYATGSEEVYVKTEAGKKRLTVMQIQQELLRRMAVPRREV